MSEEKTKDKPDSHIEETKKQIKLMGFFRAKVMQQINKIKKEKKK